MASQHELLSRYVSLFEYMEPAGTVARSWLDALYQHLPAKLPPLYEALILGYRWVEVELKDYCLLDHPPGEDLRGLLASMRGDKGLWEFLLPRGYVQFGRGAGGNYDPVCFDVNRRRKQGDCPIVRLDHEAILCDYRLVICEEMAGSFADLVSATIERA